MICTTYHYYLFTATQDHHYSYVHTNNKQVLLLTYGMNDEKYYLITCHSVAMLLFYIRNFIFYLFDFFQDWKTAIGFESCFTGIYFIIFHV